MKIFQRLFGNADVYDVYIRLQVRSSQTLRFNLKKSVPGMTEDDKWKKGNVDIHTLEFLPMSGRPICYLLNLVWRSARATGSRGRIVLPLRDSRLLFGRVPLVWPSLLRVMRVAKNQTKKERFSAMGVKG
jgi:hypothetical protein